VLAALVLRNKDAWRVLGEWESSFLAQRLAAVPIDRPVFIAGLARAGSTMLLRTICEMPEFASHQYGDFPFVFTPYAWGRLRKLLARSPEIPRERMHKDGILVTSESPEAMEEVLWIAFFPGAHDPSQSNVLEADHSHPAFEAFLADHVRKLILTRAASRYVSKNNYNVVRIKYLARIFPDARFLIPVRNPVEHVASCVKQHHLFCQLQGHSLSIRKQLKLLGHFEFGFDRRPINSGDPKTIERIQSYWNSGDEVRGWSKYWASIYWYIAQLLEGDRELARRCVVVRYEDFCDRAHEMLRVICDHVGLASAPIDRLAAGLHKPDYYIPDFTAAEHTIISQETREVARFFGYC
jgi:hypothetical protein